MFKNPFAALYIHVWAYINASLRVCVCRLRCEVTGAAAWRLMQTGFHFHGGISRGGIGVLHCVKGHFGCLSWHPCAVTTTLIGAPSAPFCSFSHRFTLGWADREGANLSTPAMKLPASLRRGYLQISEAVLKWCRTCLVNTDDLQEQDFLGIQLLLKMWLELLSSNSLP